MMPYASSPHRPAGLMYGTQRTLVPRPGSMALPPPPLYCIDVHSNQGILGPAPPNSAEAALPQYRERFFASQAGPYVVDPTFSPVLSLDDARRRDMCTSGMTPISPRFQKPIVSPRSVVSSCDATASLTAYATDTSSLGSPIPSPSYGQNYLEARAPNSFRGGSPAGGTSFIPSVHCQTVSKRRKSTTFSSSPVATPRSSKHKTELCRNFEKHGYCSYGKDCWYAHGLKDKKEQEPINRTKPCLTWISTGACPFGIRCVCFHDPRVKGSSTAWLLHTETQGNATDTDINVDALHQKYLNVILHDNPFGSLLPVGKYNWDTLYHAVCRSTGTSRRKVLVDLHKLSIALCMRNGSDFKYKYLPRNIIYGQFCMVLEARTFALKKSGKVVPIPLSSYNPSRSDHVNVRKIAFGPDSAPSVRRIALWFDIPDQDVTTLSLQQARKIRVEGSKRGESDVGSGVVPSKLDAYVSFEMVYPQCSDSHQLVTDILRHRLETVRMDNFPLRSSTRASKLQELRLEEDRLKEVFSHQKRFWKAWSWPNNALCNPADDPPAEARYEPLVTRDQGIGFSNATGAAIETIWNSYIQNIRIDDIRQSDNKDDLKSRLPIFERLENGCWESADPSLPHIVSSRQTQSPVESQIRRESERCWRSLLTEDALHPLSNNEWGKAFDHFSKDSKRLDILQM